MGPNTVDAVNGDRWARPATIAEYVGASGWCNAGEEAALLSVSGAVRGGVAHVRGAPTYRPA